MDNKREAGSHRGYRIDRVMQDFSIRVHSN